MACLQEAFMKRMGLLISLVFGMGLVCAGWSLLHRDIVLTSLAMGMRIEQVHWVLGPSDSPLPKRFVCGAVSEEFDNYSYYGMEVYYEIDKTGLRRVKKVKVKNFSDALRH
jgi:hypothetical protein